MNLFHWGQPQIFTSYISKFWTDTQDEGNFVITSAAKPGGKEGRGNLKIKKIVKSELSNRFFNWR